jgi:hypothetical protein
LDLSLKPTKKATQSTKVTAAKKVHASFSPGGKSASQQIDAIIKESSDWRGKKLSQLRILIKKTDTDMIEEV